MDSFFATYDGNVKSLYLQGLYECKVWYDIYDIDHKINFKRDYPDFVPTTPSNAHQALIDRIHATILLPLSGNDSDMTWSDYCL